ncbi:ornithine cyclodeaminase family protein [Sphingosinicella sp. CPCC 101087]|uniref:ornithine cyclodeaminase family protein n=1 Tax=Sphingosinicella sp. CPCC 101087 TaxID=2497754 RepID=UPI00101D4D85|nr:ornithine cyclodeaminase family protein [Sphingosinicella sp. CPCC 101087]
MSLFVYSAAEVAALLPYEACIPLMRQAMMALSEGATKQLPRGIIDLAEDRAFGVMPGAFPDGGPFGAKVISVFDGNFAKGLPSHQGLMLLFDGRGGAPAAVLDAGEITAIRTAAASAAATDCLARADARRLAILGYGEQAWRHVEAIRRIRPIDQVAVWGRSPERATAFAERVRAIGLEGRAASDPADAVAGAEIICTTTAAADPILSHGMVSAGVHINAVGSSRAGPAEIAEDLVTGARFFADHRASVMAQGGEYLRAKRSGLIGDDHILGEIGEVMAGSVPGRITSHEITLYKSLGNIVQDLAAAEHVHREGRTRGIGTPVPF